MPDIAALYRLVQLLSGQQAPVRAAGPAMDPPHRPVNTDPQTVSSTPSIGAAVLTPRLREAHQQLFGIGAGVGGPLGTPDLRNYMPADSMDEYAYAYRPQASDWDSKDINLPLSDNKNYNPVTKKLGGHGLGPYDLSPEEAEIAQLMGTWPKPFLGGVMSPVIRREKK